LESLDQFNRFVSEAQLGLSSLAVSFEALYANGTLGQPRGIPVHTKVWESIFELDRKVIGSLLFSVRYVGLAASLIGTSEIQARVGHRFQRRKARACRPDNPNGHTHFFSVRQLPTYARLVPIYLAGRSSRSSKNSSSSVVINFQSSLRDNGRGSCAETGDQYGIRITNSRHVSENLLPAPGDAFEGDPYLVAMQSMSRA